MHSVHPVFPYTTLGKVGESLDIPSLFLSITDVVQDIGPICLRCLVERPTVHKTMLLAWGLGLPDP